MPMRSALSHGWEHDRRGAIEPRPKNFLEPIAAQLYRAIVRFEADAGFSAIAGSTGAGGGEPVMKTAKSAGWSSGAGFGPCGRGAEKGGDPVTRFSMASCEVVTP